MKTSFVWMVVIFFIACQVKAQVGINNDGSQPDPSAMLDVKSTSKGILIPRMTTEQMNGIITPPEGLIVYNITSNTLYWFNGISWKKFNDLEYTETDPIFIVHPAHTIISNDISNWNSAYSWGNHALAGYLRNYTETDPVFSSSVAHGITPSNITNWNTAYGWGDHSGLYEPLITKSTGFLKWNGTAWVFDDTAYLSSYTETDPVFVTSIAAGITSTNTTNWNNAYGWGNHSLAGYLTSFTEIDPVFTIHPSSSITTELINQWNEAYNSRIINAGSTQPISLSIINHEIMASIPAATATSNGYLTANDWNSFNNKTGLPAGTTPGEMLYWNGSQWINVPAGSNG